MAIPWASNRRDATGYANVEHPGTRIGVVGRPKSIVVAVNSLTEEEPSQELAVYPESLPLLLPTSRMAGRLRTPLSLAGLGVLGIAAVVMRKQLVKNGKPTGAAYGLAYVAGILIALTLPVGGRGSRSPAYQEFEKALP